MLRFGQLTYGISAVCAAHLLLFGFGGNAVAIDCACVNIAAQSFADSGQCIVNETNTGVCTLDWRHGAESEESDPEVAKWAEAGALAVVKGALSGKLPQDSPFANESAWSQLYGIAKEVPYGFIYKGAATYLDRTTPTEYEEEFVLTSIAALIGSSTAARDKSIPNVVLTYFSLYSNNVYARLTSEAPSDPNIKEIPGGLIADHSAYGCFEIRRLVPGSTDPFGPFDLRVGVRTTYAGDSNCLRR